ncbi:putative holin-like toxin [Paenibacillus polysaccharolyticus]
MYSQFVVSMNFSFSDVIMFATLIIALLTYIDRKKK